MNVLENAATTISNFENNIDWKELSNNRVSDTHPQLIVPYVPSIHGNIKFMQIVSINEVIVRQSNDISFEIDNDENEMSEGESESEETEETEECEEREQITKNVKRKRDDDDDIFSFASQKY
jgi:hypothetical protein